MSGYAQDSASKKKTATVTEEFLKKAEEAIAERDHLRTVVKIKDEQLATKDEAIRTLQAITEIERLRADRWMQASQERATANTLDERTIKSFESSILDYRQNLDRVTRERDSARRSRWVWSAVAFGVGVLVGRQK